MFDPQADVLKQIMAMADEAALKKAMARKQPAQPQAPMAPPAPEAAPAAKPDISDEDAKALMEMYSNDGADKEPDADGDDKFVPGQEPVPGGVN